MTHWKSRIVLPIAVAGLLAATACVWALGRSGASGGAPTATVRVIESHPHDAGAFTQGLVIADGRLFESTGLYGQSSIREVDLETGKATRRVNLDPSLFGEGLTMLGGELYFVTWKGRIGYVLDPDTFQVKRSFRYGGQGWGLTDDGRQLILSDGSATLRWLDSASGEVTRRLTVHDAGRQIDNLNELEYIDGEIFANIWKTDRIARISAKSGQVAGWIDASGLRRDVNLAQPHEDVLNGIAYDANTKKLYLTGKRWPKVFEVTIDRNHE